MNTLLNIPRYHLVQRFNYLVLPGAIVAFVFLVDFLILELTPAGHGGGNRYVGGLASVVVLLFVFGTQSVARALPFGLSLGASRRTFYSGTALLALALGVVGGLAIAVLQAVERATGGWGISMGFFRVPYLLEGPWYLTWVTSLVVLTLGFVSGMWFGLVYRRWNLLGLVAFIAGQVTVLLAGALITTWWHAWSSVGHFFTTLSASGLTGLLAAVTVVLVAGGYATMRHVNV
jgi:hypothetical protein